jgi:hypothetical protein
MSGAAPLKILGIRDLAISVAARIARTPVNGFSHPVG